MQQPDQVLFQLKANNKKAILQKAADLLAVSTGTEAVEIYERLAEREKLGSTGMGAGVAIPHARLQGLDRVHTVLLTLADAAEFDALDDKPVDIVFALIAPQDAGADHLQALAKVSRMLRNREFCHKLRGANSADGLASLLLNYEDQIAA